MKARIKYSLLVIFGGILLLQSCRKDLDPAVLNIEFRALYNGEPFKTGEVYYDHLGHRIRCDVFMTYVSDIVALETDDSGVLLKDIDLLNFQNENIISVEIDPGEYKGLGLGLGVPADKNKDQDPNQYPNDHPLSVNGAQGMFWFWNTGYIFTKYEGKVDLDGQEGNELTDPMAFHCGEDYLYHYNYYRESFEMESGETKSIIVYFNVEDFLQSEDDSIDLELDYLTHTSGNTELAERFINCFVNSIEVKFE